MKMVDSLMLYVGSHFGTHLPFGQGLGPHWGRAYGVSSLFGDGSESNLYPAGTHCMTQSYKWIHRAYDTYSAARTHTRVPALSKHHSGRGGQTQKLQNRTSVLHSPADAEPVSSSTRCGPCGRMNANG
eukprot:SAG31_NODE_20702_length_567_cov_1.303419_1_plen_127_part_01